MLKPDTALRKDRRGSNAIETLQHRHYAAIAGIIANLPDQDMAREEVAEHFARALAANPRFDRDRFLAAAEKREEE